MPSHVKTRRYDSSRRRAAARARRQRILDVAGRLMERDGYDATTVSAIAEESGVSAETIYKAFGGKPGLVRGLFERALEGAGPIPAETRSDTLRDTDPATLVSGWARLATEVAPRGAAVMVLVRAAASSDPAMGELYHEMDARRLRRMQDNARALAAIGGLRDGITVEEAGDVLFTVSSPEMYELLVTRRGWSIQRYSRYVRDTITHALLP
ncbi:MAG: helix-turn-helix transcriptional regulator [Nocardioides sp.]|nr:helix-turn-helix transcriptional regulator [Nocardioides sp.]